MIIIIICYHVEVRKSPWDLLIGETDWTFLNYVSYWEIRSAAVPANIVLQGRVGNFVWELPDFRIFLQKEFLANY